MQIATIVALIWDWYVIVSYIPTVSPAGLLIFSILSREGSLFSPAHALLDPDLFWVCIPGIPRPPAAWQGTHLSPRGTQFSTAVESHRSPPYLSPEVGPSPCWGPQILCIVLPDQCRADVRLSRQRWKVPSYSCCGMFSKSLKSLGFSFLGCKWEYKC